MKPHDRNTANMLRAVVGPRTEGYGARIVALAAKIDRWEEVIEDSKQHGILPRLYSEMAANRTAIPADALQRIETEFERNAFHCFANAAELLEVLKMFESAGIAAIPFKGVVLGASAYGDMTARSAGDLDVLIYPHDLRKATRILEGRDYRMTTKVRHDGWPEAENCFEYHFERSTDGMVVELRWRLELTARYPRKLGMDWAWPHRRTTKLAGSDVLNLEPEVALLLLSMHGSKHVWSRLMWICDIAKLIESEPGLNWNSAQREAKHVGLWRCLALGVLMARRITGAEIPAEVLRNFEADRTAKRLSESLEKHLWEDPASLPGGRVPYNFQLLGFRDRARVVLSPSFLRPAERDRAWVKLPKALEPLYFVIRPIRLLLDRTGR